MQSRMIVSAAGVLLVGWLPHLPPLYLPLFCAFFFWWGRRIWPRPATLFVCFFLGVSYGALWGQQWLALRLPAGLEQLPLDAVVTVLEPPRVLATSHRQRQRFAARVVLKSCPQSVQQCRPDLGRVLLSYYGKQTFRAGERWRLTVKLKQPRGLANPGSANIEAWLARRRLVATGYVRDEALQRLPDANGLWIPRWRQSISDRLAAATLPKEAAGVLLALSNGDRSGLSRQEWERFQRYGLNHLAVISGLHVGMVAGLGFLLGRLVSRRTGHVAAASIGLVYSALAGFALPTQRALVMLAGVQLAALAGRRITPANGLAMALLGVAVLDPLASHGAGFWLSFGAVAWILYLNHMWPGRGLWRSALLVQLSLAPAMGLLASFWFGGLGWLAPLANLVAIPVLSFWIAPLCLLAAMLPALDTTLWSLAAWPVQGFVWLDTRLASLDALWWTLRPAPAGLLVGMLALLALFAHRQLRLLPAGLALALLAMILLPHRADTERSEFWLLDVGQGLAAVLLHREFTLVYDTGDGLPEGPNMASSVIVPFLETRGVRHIDLLVISHRDSDHASGVYSLHHRFPVGATWVGEAPFHGLEGQHPCVSGMTLEREGLTVSVLSPPTPAGDGNNQSCVLQVTAGGARLLLPGDIESSREHDLLRHRRADLPADLIVVPHHGSRSSSTSAFLNAVGPRWALLSRGYRNRFGHPHQEALDRLAIFGLDPCDTATQGALRYDLSGGAVEALSGWRAQRAFYWQGAASTACAPAYNGALTRP